MERIEEGEGLDEREKLQLFQWRRENIYGNNYDS